MLHIIQDAVPWRGVYSVEVMPQEGIPQKAGPGMSHPLQLHPTVGQLAHRRFSCMCLSYKSRSHRH